MLSRPEARFGATQAGTHGGSWICLALGAALAGCSAFNVSPRCEATARGLQEIFAIPRITGPVDGARLDQIVHVENLVETGSGYNERTCSALVTVGKRSTIVSYRVRQSEGLQNWYGAELLQPNDPTLVAMAAEAQAAYQNHA